MKKETVNATLVVAGMAIAAVGHYFGWIRHNGEMWVTLLAIGAVSILAGFFLEYRRTHPFGWFR